MVQEAVEGRKATGMRRGALHRARPRVTRHQPVHVNHVHLLVEADAERALSRGLRAFMTACARSINAHRARTGRVFAGRYCMTLVTSPRQARNTLAYVINNWRRHREDRGAAVTAGEGRALVAADDRLAATPAHPRARVPPGDREQLAAAPAAPVRELTDAVFEGEGWIRRPPTAARIARSSRA